MIEVFRKVREIDFFVGVKFDNIEAMKETKDEVFLEACDGLFSEEDLAKLRDIFQKDIKILASSKKSVFPFPVRNSKFNNFVILYNGTKMFFWRKSEPFEKAEVYPVKEEVFSTLKRIAQEKFELLKNFYSYAQVVFPWDNEERMLKLCKIWDNFVRKSKFFRFFDTIYFSFFMEVGYEPSSLA